MAIWTQVVNLGGGIVPCVRSRHIVSEVRDVRIFLGLLSAEQAAPTVESEAATVDAPARPVAVATAIPEGPALAPSASPPEEVQVELQFEVQVEVGQAEPANEATRETEPVETGAPAPKRHLNSTEGGRLSCKQRLRPLAPTASAAHSGQAQLFQRLTPVAQLAASRTLAKTRLRSNAVTCKLLPLLGLPIRGH